MSNKIETYQMHAYVDGELSTSDNIEIEKAMEVDASLREEIMKISALKRRIKDTYQNVDVPPFQSVLAQKKSRWKIPMTAVASLFVGVLLGFFAVNTPFNSSMVGFTPQAQLAEQKYLIHLDSEDRSKWSAALQKTQQLLETDPAVQVEFLTNSEGVQLFDVNSPDRENLEALLERFDNLSLFACSRAMQRAMDKSPNFKPIPQVNHDMPGVDTVVDRVNTGWKYIKI